MKPGGNAATRRRVCIVTPSQLGSNPRVVKEADTLQAAGFDVTVIAVRTMDEVDDLDRALLRRRNWCAQRIDLRAGAVRRRLRVRQLAARGVYAATGLNRFAEEGISPFVWPLIRAALQTPAQLYVAHYPAALPAVAAAARRHGGAYAYDAEDFHLGDWSAEPVYDLERRLLREVEGAHLPRCAYVTAASPAIAEAYATTYGIPTPRVILNTFPLAQAPSQATPAGSARPGPSLYWFSQTTGPERGLETAVTAIAQAESRPHFYLRGTPADGYASTLHDLAVRLGVEGRLHLLSPGAPDAMATLAAEYDLGLSSDIGQTPNRRMCLTNKLFTYLLAGVPPLMSDTPGQVAFAREAGLSGLVYSGRSPDSLAAVIDGLLLSPTRLAAARSTAWRLGREAYCWEREEEKVVEHASQATSRAVA